MKYKNAITYGLLSGLAIICYHLAIYYGNKDMLVAGYFPYTIYLLQLPFMIAVGLKFRFSNEDLIDFKDALREVLITFLVGTAIYFACYYFLFNTQEELIVMQKEKAHENIMWLKEQGIYKKMKSEIC